MDSLDNFSSTLSTLASEMSSAAENMELDLDYIPVNHIVPDEISRFSRPLLTFAAVMTIIIMILGIFGNLLTIVALLKCPKVRNVAAAFIVSLCLADCIFCAVVLPFNAFRYIHGTWTHGDFLCRIIPLMQYGNIGVSLLCIAMITINRYIMIAHHSSYTKIYKRHWIGAMIAFCWIFAYGMQLPTFFKVWGAFGYDPKLGTCSILTDAQGRSSKTALYVIAFVIPCLIIIGCYAKIFWVVHKSESRLRRHATKQNSIPNNLRQMPSTGVNRVSSPVSSSTFNETSGADSKYGTAQKAMRVKDQRDIKAKRNEWRITKMVLAIFLSFIVCYLPITLVKVTDKDVHYPGFHIFGYIMLYLSACINPIIYVIMNKQYRQAYKTVLMCKPSRLLPFTNAGSSAGEKWKDIGYSYNHSRTMVSQVSLADQNTSFSSTTQPPQPPGVSMAELTPKQPAISQCPDWSRNSNGNTNPTFPINSSNKNSEFTITTSNISPTTTTPTTTTINNNSITHANLQTHPLTSVQLHVEPQPQSIQRRDFQRPGIRITLAEEDVIIEEEEPQAPSTPTSSSTEKRMNLNNNAPATVVNSAASMTDPLNLKQSVGVYRTSNINDIPDSSKVTTKKLNFNNN